MSMKSTRGDVLGCIEGPCEGEERLETAEHSCILTPALCQAVPEGCSTRGRRGAEITSVTHSCWALLS